MRLGIFGGSFDPVHLGHLILAEACREACGLDEVRFIPAAVPPHKRDCVLARPEQRVEMLQLAVGGHSAFSVSTIELDRGGVSYTVETLAAIAHDAPSASLFLLIGADSLAEMTSWHQPAEICRLATPVVARRPGQASPDFDKLRNVLQKSQVDSIRRHMLETPLIQLSSTDIRRRVAANQSIRYRTTRAVEQYIREKNLYQGNDS